MGNNTACLGVSACWFPGDSAEGHLETLDRIILDVATTAAFKGDTALAVSERRSQPDQLVLPRAGRKLSAVHAGVGTMGLPQADDCPRGQVCCHTGYSI